MDSMLHPVTRQQHLSDMLGRQLMPCGVQGCAELQWKGAGHGLDDVCQALDCPGALETCLQGWPNNVTTQSRRSDDVEA